MDWFLLGLSYVSLFAFGLVDNARGPTFPDIMSDFALSNSLASLTFLFASVGSLANNLLSFIWLEKLGAVGALRVYSMVQAIGVLLLGLSKSFEGLIVGSLVFGLSSGALGIVVNLLAAGAVGAGRRRQALSGLHCMYGVSSLLAPLVVSQVYSSGGDWRTVFVWLASGPALVGLLALHGRAGPIRLRILRAAEAGASLGVESAERRVPAAERPRKAALFYGTMLTLYVVAEVLVSTRLVLFARRELGYGSEEANFLLSGFFLLLFLGRLLFALVRFPLSNATLLAISAGASLLAFVFGLTIHPYGLAFCGFAMAVFYPCAIALVAEDLGRGAEFATSWAITIQSCGLMIMHFSVGAMSDAFGIGRALWVGPVCLVFVLGLLGLRSSLRQRFQW